MNLLRRLLGMRRRSTSTVEHDRTLAVADRQLAEARRRNAEAARRLELVEARVRVIRRDAVDA